MDVLNPVLRYPTPARRASEGRLWITLTIGHPARNRSHSQDFLRRRCIEYCRAPSTSFGERQRFRRADRIPSGRLALRTGRKGSFVLLEIARTPRLELLTNVFGGPVRGDDDMHVVGATVDGVELPVPDCAVVGDGLLDDGPLILIEYAGRFRHARSRTLPANGIRDLKSSSAQHPASFVAGKPGAVGRPSEKERDGIRERGFRRVALCASARHGRVRVGTREGFSAPGYRLCLWERVAPRALAGASG